MLAEAAPNKFVGEGAEATDVVELLEMLPKAGGAVVGGVAAAGNPPPKLGVEEVVVVEPNEGAEVVDPKPNFGTVDEPKAGAEVDAVRAGATEVAPPNVKPFVVAEGAVVGAGAAAVVVGFRVDAPNAKLPLELDAVRLVVVAATVLPKDGTLEGLVTTGAEEATGETALKALNPDPLPPKAGTVAWVVLREFWGLSDEAFVEMAGRSEKLLLGASILDIGAGEKLIRFDVEVVEDATDDANGKPEVVCTGAAVAGAVEGKL